MSQAPTVEPTPAQPATPMLNEDAFVADRQRFWGTFTGFATFAVVALIVLLVGMAFFLT